MFEVFYPSACGGRMVSIGLIYALYGNHPTILKMIDDNFNVNSDVYRGWQDAEIPFNALCIEHQYDVRIRNENDTKDSYIINKNHHNILVFTDIVSQYYLAEYKDALWFNTDGRVLMAHDLLKFYNDCYNNVKDESWPIMKYKSILNLPSDIKIEFMQRIGADKLDDVHDLIKFRLKDDLVECEINGMKYNVWKHSVPGLAKECHSFDLRDIVKSQFKCITDAYQIPYHIGLKKYVEMWLSLHSTYIQKMLLG